MDQPQYIATAIPVQPFTAVLSPQNQIQDHLQRKHEELQKLIIEQQNELRRVSEQLFMARYGIISVPADTLSAAENSCISTSSHATQILDNQSQCNTTNNNQQSTTTFVQHDEFELLPFQLNQLNHAQILFSSDKEPNVSK
jgi:hypothetical protein